MTYKNQSDEYKEARRYVLQLEIAARRALEEAAAARRRLPEGPLVETDYVFEEMNGSTIQKVKLSELFRDKPTLAIYSWMFNEKMKRACPMCTGMIDSWDGIVRHVTQRAELVIVADSPITRLMQFKKEHGWKNLRLVSTAGSNYNRDYLGVTPDGNAVPNLNVFKKSEQGVRHFYGGDMMAMKADVGQDPRGLDTLNPIFQFFDYTPEGRGDFYTKLDYPLKSSL
jgi:predicted dithiol-disulfide oxidoreductase (DUF899 family)